MRSRWQCFWLLSLVFFAGCASPGSSTPPSISAAPSSLQFGSVTVDTEVTLRVELLSGPSSSLELSAALEGPLPDAFRLESTGLLRVDPTVPVSVGVVFRPSTEGDFEASLLLRGPGGVPELAIALAGRGLARASCTGPSCPPEAGSCERAPQVCADGGCVWTAAPVGTGCDDQDLCTQDDRCQADGCQGDPVPCQSPPASVCLDEDTLRVYEATGSCGRDGGCSYRPRSEPCLSGCEAQAARCRTACAVGLHRCGADCVSDSEVGSCGSRCSPCLTPANGIPSCNGISCGFTCQPRFYRCASACCPEGTGTVMSTSLGSSHSCSLSQAGAVKCWGSNVYGQLGVGFDGGIRTTPADVIGLSSGVTALGMRGQHSCALMEDGGVSCWGANASGRLGDGTRVDRAYPTRVVGLAAPAKILGGATFHNCVVVGTGTVQCWGSNALGQLGNGGVGTDAVRPVTVSNLSGVDDLFTAFEFSCARRQAGFWCWGSNMYGQLGTGSATGAITEKVPVQGSAIPAGTTVLAMGFAHTCGVTAAGAVRCWGRNNHGQLGNGVTVDSAAPVEPVGLSSGVVSVAAGSEFSCALTSGGAVKCWGNNGLGQLGDGTTTSSPLPVDVFWLSNGVSGLWTGRYHACALHAGHLECWGSNGYGQLGDGSTTDSPRPVPVQGL